MITRLRWLRDSAIAFLREGVATASNAWNRFWFTPTDPTTLGLIRVLAGLMLLYTHAIWTLDLDAFFGEQSWLSREVIAEANRGGYSWSTLSWCRNSASLWAMHVVALASFTLLTIGLWTRVAAVLAFVFTVSYAHRTPGALYGLDQVNSLLSLYLLLGPSGSRFSVDAWRARRNASPLTGLAPVAHGTLHYCLRDWKRPCVMPTQAGALSITANLSIRLIQCHLCVIYLFAGLSKLQGLTWWNGFAFWGGIANQEYQTLDLTWLADWPLVINTVTHLTVAFELSYCVLVWNRWTRPLMLLGAVALHLGIVVALGMPTFGLAMLIANVSFISPSFVRSLIGGPAGREPSESATTIRAPHFSKRPTGATGERRLVK